MSACVAKVRTRSPTLDDSRHLRPCARISSTLMQLRWCARYWFDTSCALWSQADADVCILIAQSRMTWTPQDSRLKPHLSEVHTIFCWMMTCLTYECRLCTHATSSLHTLIACLDCTTNISWSVPNQGFRTCVLLHKVLTQMFLAGDSDYFGNEVFRGSRGSELKKQIFTALRKPCFLEAKASCYSACT